MDTMTAPSQEEEEHEVIYISDHDDDEEDEVHWVAISAAKPSNKENIDAEALVVSSDEDESDNATKKEGDNKNKDQPLKIQVLTEEGTIFPVHVFPHFLVSMVMWLAHQQRSLNYAYTGTDCQLAFEGKVLNELRTITDYKI